MVGSVETQMAQIRCMRNVERKNSQTRGLVCVHMDRVQSSDHRSPVSADGWVLGSNVTSTGCARALWEATTFIIIIIIIIDFVCTSLARIKSP